MSFRSWLIPVLAPSLFPGIRFGDWCRLLRDNRFRVNPRFGVRAASISFFSVVNSMAGWIEDLRYGSQIQSAEIEQPVFILGHWRSGTTFLQNLFALDSRFASPSLYDVLFPHTFLTTERFLSRILSNMLPRTRHTDNVRFGLDVPYEDEFAICTSSFCSPHVSMVFPQRADYYDRYLTLRDLSEAEVARWRCSLMHFFRKLSLKYHRRLVLKSPPHTARIRYLRELFPGAKFIHIHRNPYDVYQSAVKTAIDSSVRQRLQIPTIERFEDRVIRLYKLMYDAFFEDQQLLSTEDYCEICYEDLEREPVAELRRAYETLGLPDFAEIDSGVRRYCQSVREYRKNSYPQLPDPLRQRIAQEWQRTFDEWGYPK